MEPVPEPEADVHSLNCSFHLSAGDGFGLVRHAGGLRHRVDVDGHNTRELLQSPRHTLGSEMAEDPVGPEGGLGPHPWTAPARTAGTRRSIRTTMYPMIAPRMLLERKAVWNHQNVR